MNVQNSLKKAVKIVGSQTELASQLGINKQNITQWINSSKIPAEHCLSIEELTKGIVKVEDLCPKLKWYVVANRGKVNP